MKPESNELQRNFGAQPSTAFTRGSTRGRISLDPAESDAYRYLIPTETEKAVLGSFLLEPTLLSNVESASLERDLSLSSHRTICRRILDLHNSSNAIDVFCVVEELSSHGELESVGGVAYVSDMVVGSVPELTHVQHLISIIRKKAVLRRIVSAAQNLQKAATEFGACPGEILQVFTEQIGDIKEQLLGIRNCKTTAARENSQCE